MEPKDYAENMTGFLGIIYVYLVSSIFQRCSSTTAGYSPPRIDRQTSASIVWRKVSHHNREQAPPLAVAVRAKNAGGHCPKYKPLYKASVGDIKRMLWLWLLFFFLWLWLWLFFFLWLWLWLWLLFFLWCGCGCCCCCCCGLVELVA